ncbi:hypothetical protein ASU85_19820 [Klebsiella aerogenes]|uniref:hypothetical protein n=1 Tax=Klebsiella aerogenes TaxID=548 RepID=UPI0007359777|nr:hypothetical protein [Klebsiella aerogenes]KTJ39468.1 hypothetical protein ASU85_19820 [Klebsiella aerogenes]
MINQSCLTLAINCFMGIAVVLPYHKVLAENSDIRVSYKTIEKHDKNKHDVYNYDLTNISEQSLKNELKLKDQLNKGWIRFTMTIGSIECVRDTDCYAIPREGQPKLSFRVHNNTFEHYQWLKHTDVGDTIDIVCGTYLDNNSYYDMIDCVPFVNLDPSLLNIYNNEDN